MQKTPLDQARTLILSITRPEDAHQKITELQQYPSEELHEQLENYYNTAPRIAAQGDTQGISTMLRVFEHFGDRSHDRMLLHYIAQAEANKGLSELNTEQTPHHEDMKTILALISDAFTDANSINAQKGTK